MASKKEIMTRSGLALLAILFLVTSVGFTILVIWQGSQENKQETAQIENLTQEQDKPMLQGTKLEGFTPVEKVDTLQVTDTVPGTGKEVTASSTVTAHYTGALAKDGTIFQSSLDTGQPFTSELNGLIEGWIRGIPGMKEGGTRRLLIPAALAYGPQEKSGIPANSDLVFDIQLVAVQ